MFVVLLIIAGFIAGVLGLMIFVGGSSAIHEIEGILIMIVAGLSWVSAAALHYLTEIRNLLKYLAKKNGPRAEDTQADK